MSELRAFREPGHGREPLRGIRVLSFAQLLLAPRAVQMLGDLGAEVIKVERPGVGAWERQNSTANYWIDGVSLFALGVNRNQRSLTLNLKDPQGAAIARRLVAWADVLVENYRPGVMERLGLGYEQLRELNPRLIYATGCGYGSSGPYRDKPGQDLLVQALGGMTWLTGRRSDPPVPMGVPVADMHGGTLLALAIVTALFHRERTGEGQRLEVDLLSSVIDLQMEPATVYLNGGALQRSATGIADTFHAGPYGVYRSRDGFLALSLVDLSELAELLSLDALGHERFRRPGAAFDLRDEIYDLVAPVIAEKPTRYWIEKLEPHDVWCAEVRGYAEVFADPQVEQNQMVIEVEHPRLGPLRFTGLPMRFSGSPGSIRLPPPDVGEHTDPILQALGMTEKEIAALRAQGVV